MNWIPYYGVCASLWFIAWVTGLWYFQSRRQHGPLLKRLSWPRRISLLAVLAAIPVSYGYSYPLYQHLVAAYPGQRNWLASMSDLYIPAQFSQHPSWSYEPFLYPLALAAIVLIPFVVQRIVLVTRVRQRRVAGLMLVGLLAVACFITMLVGPL